LERARKARRNKNYGLIQEAVVLWEEARRHDVAPAKRAKLVTAILAKVQGHVAELAGSHSASRVIQTCAKYGSPAGAQGSTVSRHLAEQPRSAAEEHAGWLAASPWWPTHPHSMHACVHVCTPHTYVLLRMPPTERAAILKEVEPKLLELSKSPYGHFVVSKLVALATKEQLPGG